MVEVVVGGLDELFVVEHLFIGDGSAEAECDADLHTVKEDLLCFDALSELFGDLEGLPVLCFREEKGKFFAAVAGEHVFHTDAVSNQSCCAFEDVVTCEVSVGVVEFLEEVDIHQDQAEVSLVSFGAAEFSLKAVEEVAFVVDGGEAICGGQPIELLVVDIFEVVAAEKFEDHFANFDAVSVAEDCFIDEDVIDIGSVGATKVLNEILVASGEELGMIA